MYFKQFFNEQLAQMSYIIGCQKTGEAIIIDPLRDLTPYIEAAEKEGLSIQYVTETHIHADFASGIREAVDYLGAKAYVSGHGGVDWSYQAIEAIRVTEGDVIQIGNIKLQVVHTPGHTPESISFILYDNGMIEPMGMFTGDFIFVGDVGRPDLLEEAAGVKDSTQIGAKQMFESIQNTSELPDHMQIWPGHGAGSACGKALGAVPMTTLGYERKTNWAFQISDENSFIKALTSEQPEPPLYFAQMKVINRDGDVLYKDDTVYPLLKGKQVIDLRPKEIFAEQQSEGINIPFNKQFLSFVGWYVDYGKDMHLIGDYLTVQHATKALKLIGFNKVSGYTTPRKIKGNAYEQISPRAFKSMKRSEINILDVRTNKEWEESHFEEAKHVHFGKLNIEKIPFEKDKTIYVHCQSGVRSAIAMSVLKLQGFKNIINIKGGYSQIKE